MPFEALRHCLAKKNKNVQNVVCKPCTRLAFIPDGKLQLWKFGHAQKAKFQDTVWV